MMEPDLVPERLPDRAAELEDLLRILFFEYVQITLGRLLSSQAGYALIEVYAYGADRIEEQLIVLFGLRQGNQDLDPLQARYMRRMGSKSLEVVHVEETLRYRATSYSLIDCQNEISTFATFYQTRSAADVAATVHELFETMLAPWHRRNPSFVNEHTLKELCLDWLHLPASSVFSAELEQRAHSICREMLARGLAQIEYAPHQIAMRLDKQTVVTYPNPTPGFHELHVSGNAPILCGLAPSALDIDLILVDRNSRTWFIPFGKLTKGPLFRDFVSLETAIKLDLIEDLDLPARLTLEQCLSETPALDAVPAPHSNAELQKALSIISQIRAIAAGAIDHDLKSYQAGLFFCAIRRIAMYQPDRAYARNELIPYAHALLSAALLYACLVKASDPKTLLWFDPKREEVWIEGKLASLTQQEYKFFKALYDRAGQLCTRQTIMQAALGRDYSVSEESLFNSTMSRLRLKIEPNPAHAQYIINIRGRGYLLDKQRIRAATTDQAES
jgi:DNA-binding winged helix-turn-helix (wHTH) protein